MPHTETNFTFRQPQDLSQINFFSFGNFIGNNAGTLRTRSGDDCLSVIANPFMFDRASGGGVLDHVKTLLLSDPQSVGANDIYEARTRLGGRIIQPSRLPSFVCDKNDPRLGSIAMVVISSDFLVLDFIITNDKIYALYERLPFGWANGPYSAFTSVHFLKRRRPKDIHDLKITVNRKTRKVTWSADGESVSINNPGLQPGRSYNGRTFNNHFRNILILNPPGPVSMQTDLSNLSSFQVGFGLFTLMDMAAFDSKGSHNHSDNDSSDSSDSDDNNNHNIGNNCPRPSQGYIQLRDTPYRFPTDWLFDFSLPISGTARFSNDPNVQTTYGQGGLIKICELGYSIKKA